MELIWIGVLVVIAIVLLLLAVPLVQRQRRSGSVRAVVPEPSHENGGQKE